MNMKNVILLVLCAILLLTACEKENVEAIKLIEGQTEHLTWADETQGNGSLIIKTTGAWTSTIIEDNGSQSTSTNLQYSPETCDWLRIEPMSGDTAGIYSISIILNGNFTGVDRLATITINSDGKTIPITIKQVGKTEEGKIPDKHVMGLSLNKSSLSLDKWTTEKLIESITPEYAENKTVFWSSSNESVVTVDENGIVTPNKWASVGANATVTAITQDGAKTALCVVSIVYPISNGEGLFTATDINEQISEQFAFDFARQSSSPTKEGDNLINVAFINPNETFNCNFIVPSSIDYLKEGIYHFVNEYFNYVPGKFYCDPLLINNKQYATGGTATVDLSGDIYTITFNIDTSYNNNPGKITGTYTGKIRKTF